VAGILDGLNDAQRRAVVHDTGPLLIVAGAGTGKTRVVTHRIAHLITESKARPHEILALTFTDKAAAEMEERVDQLVPYGYADVEISTFHAFGDRILREHSLEVGLAPDFRVLSRAEQVIFFRDRIFEFPLERYRPLGDPTRHIQAIISLVSRCKDEDISPAEYHACAEQLRLEAAGAPGGVGVLSSGAPTFSDDERHDRAAQQAELAATFARYQELMARESAVDFGDQIVLALNLLRARPHVLNAYQRRFRYILVDEFQDTNHAQFEMVKLLAARHRNLAVVCDDDQAIYRFRGAALSNIEEFVANYADAPRIVLTENYRSHQGILDAAYRLIRYNDPDRLEAKDPAVSKRLVAVGEPPGREPMHLHYETATQEADAVSAMIQEKVEAGAWRYEDVAVLVRSNRDADAFLRSLNLRNLPWTFSGNAGLYGRPEVRLLIAFLRTVAHPDESVSVHFLASSEIYNAPIVDLTTCATWADRKHRPLFEVLRRAEELAELRDGLSEEGRFAIRAFVADIVRFMERAREMPTGELLYQFLVDSGRLAQMSKAASARDEAEVQNISKFFRRIQDVSKALRYDNVREFVKHLDALIDAGDDPAVAEADVETPAVHVLTVHKAKGLEFPVVFLVDLVQDKFPSRGRKDAIEVPLELRPDARPPADFHRKEERRLFYVGMTRAQRELYLTSARDYGGSRPRKVSQFVLEALDLPKDAAKPFKTKAVEEIERFAPPAEAGELPLVPIAPEVELLISHKQIEEYRSCPLKYRYAYILRVPQPRHHALVYGATIHEVVEFYLRRRAAGNFTSLDDLHAEYEKKWVNQGFLSWEHQEARRAAGQETLTRFWNQQEAAGVRPSFVEKEFSFSIGNDRVRGRFDRVDEEQLGAAIIDYKTGEVATLRHADDRARKSLQLKIYALAWREMTGALPERVELHFLESHTVGRHQPTEADAEEATIAITEAAAGMRARRFDAAPSFNACRYCSYRQICPYTATKE
jgi:DNA helicase-2/ATP-dependent DNA helicase PcrA